MTIIGMASLINLVHKTEVYTQVLEFFHLDFKPFTCVMCSTFWFTLGFVAMTNPTQCIFIAAATAILAELISIQIHKL